MANGILKVGEITTSSGSGTITLGQSGETIAFGSGVTPGAGVGKLINVVNNVYGTANQTISTSTFTDITGSETTVTPRNSSSKFLINFTQHGVRKTTNNTYVGLRLMRKIGSGSYSEIEFITNGHLYDGTTGTQTSMLAFEYYDSPATSDEVNYKVQFRSGTNNANVSVFVDGTEYGAIILKEIAG